MRFFLIGFMGSGKSFWANKLSERFVLPLVDLDKAVEQEMNMSISDIIEYHGEETFRKKESDLLAQRIQQSNKFIMATGGGTPCFQENMNLMNASGISLYLKTDIETLTKRLLAERNHRPLLRGLKDEELALAIQALLFKREEYYTKCKHSIDMDQDPESTFVEIFESYA